MFDEYIKVKNKEDRNIEIKKIFLGNINFMTELIKIEILSKKIGPNCLINLYNRYQKVHLDEVMRELTIEGLILFTEKFGRIIYKKIKTIKEEYLKEYLSVIDDIFEKLKNIKKEEGLSRYIKDSIINLEEKRKNNFLTNKIYISQDSINLRMKIELQDYKDSLNTNKKEKEKYDIWKETTFIIYKRITYRITFGKIFGDILEGFFVNAGEIMKEEENPEYLQSYLCELIDYYYKNFSKKNIIELSKRLINLFSDLIINIGLDIPNIYDIYSYTLHLFMEYNLMDF